MCLKEIRKMKLTSVVMILSIILLTFGLYMIFVEPVEYEEQIIDIDNDDIKMNWDESQDSINFDEITVEDYCNTKKGRADIFCKHEL